jgi:hypothetical protein
MKFKIGDRVKINENCATTRWHGLKGTVVKNPDAMYRDHLVCVRLDKAIDVERDPHLCWLTESSYTLIPSSKYFEKR